MAKEPCRNDVTIAGLVVGNPQYSHSTRRGTTYYKLMLAVKRKSGTDDVIPICFPEDILDPNDDYEGRYFRFCGEYHSKNKFYDGKNHLILSVYASEAESIDSYYVNDAEIEGFVCKPTYFKEKLSGARVTEVTIATNRSYGGTSYIPCLLWNDAAEMAKGFKVGDHFIFRGRIQSRGYEKKFEDGSKGTRTAYEFSVFNFEKIEEVEDESNS